MAASDSIKLAAAGGATLATAIAALRAGRPSIPVRGRGRPAPVARPTLDDPTPAATADGRLRILTGEPATPEERRSAPRRAGKLVAGIAMLALVGAVGLVVLVRALIEMVQQIGN